MPTVLRFAGFNVIIYANDHRPPHVHVTSSGSEAVFNLRCPDGPIELRENYGFSRADISRIRGGLDRSIETLCRSWRKIHGQGG